MSVMTAAAPVPDWLIPPEGGFTADDLDRLPDLPPHTELIDGSLILVSAQAHFHTLVLRHLEFALLAHLPDDLDVRREMTVVLGPRQRPEPDLVVYRARENEDVNGTRVTSSDIRLVAEVVSPESRERDRKRKPVLYAESGIPFFWRIENEGSNAVLYTFELNEATATYEPTGIRSGKFELEVPYRVEIDFDKVHRRGQF